VLRHAGHRHGDQAVGLVVLEDVAPLAVQQQNDGLREHRRVVRSEHPGARWGDGIFLHPSGELIVFISMSFGGKTSETTSVSARGSFIFQLIVDGDLKATQLR